MTEFMCLKQRLGQCREPNTVHTYKILNYRLPLLIVKISQGLAQSEGSIPKVMSPRKEPFQLFLRF